MTGLLRPIEETERPFAKHAIPLYLVDRLQKAYDLRVFIETGTYLGLTVEHVWMQFQHVYTIELDPQLARLAQEKFQSRQNVHVIEGDSGVALARVLRDHVFERALVWLDAHYSGDITASLPDRHTPIVAELAALRTARNDHVLMIDDLAEFVGTNGYPTIDELVEQVREINNDYSVNIDMTLRRGVLIALPPA